MIALIYHISPKFNLIGKHAFSDSDDVNNWTLLFYDGLAETVIYRIFYYINKSGNGHLTRRELRRGNLIAAMQHADEEEDINKVLRLAYLSKWSHPQALNNKIISFKMYAWSSIIVLGFFSIWNISFQEHNSWIVWHFTVDILDFRRQVMALLYNNYN